MFTFMRLVLPGTLRQPGRRGCKRISVCLSCSTNALMVSGALYLFPPESQGGDDDGKCEVSEDCMGCDLLSGLIVATSFLTTARIVQRASL